MKKEEIKVWDWGRMLFGEVPGEFFMEVVIRSVFIFVLLLVAMRLMGRRMSAQLSRNEMLAVSSLAAAIGVPLQSPEKGLLPSLVIALIVVLAGRLLARISFRNQRFEKEVMGNVESLVEDARLQLPVMKKARITQDRLFAQLRSEGIKQLGEVKRLYMEANGTFSLVKEAQPVPGLSIIPGWDRDFRHQQQHADSIPVCTGCGSKGISGRTEGSCTHCGKKEWAQAVV